MKFKTFYNPPESVTTVLDYETKFVDQSEADMCGLSYQLQRFGIDGLAARFEAMKDKFGYADTRSIPSFAELQNRIVEGTNYFNNLPSEIRRQFGDRAENFYEYLESNPKEACEKGFISDVYAKDILSKITPAEDIKVEPQPVPSVQPVQEQKSDDVSA